VLEGIAVTDGGGIPAAASRAAAFAKLGYRTMLLMDDDRPLTDAERAPLDQAGATVLSWGLGHATEDSLFQHLDWPDALGLLAIAEEIWGAPRLEEGLRLHSNGQIDLRTCRAADLPVHRLLLARTAKAQDWFKRMDFGERVGQEILGPGWDRAAPELRTTIEAIYHWTRGGQNG
jgi:hypothetical protein